MNQFMDYLHFSRLIITSGNWDVFTISFYINAFVLLLFFGLFIYIVWQIKKNKVPNKATSFCFMAFGELLVNIIMLPSLEILISVSNCSNSGDKVVMTNFKTVQCFRGLHLITSIISYIWLACFITLIALFSLMYFEPFMNKGHPLNRSSSRCIFWMNAFIVTGIFVDSFSDSASNAFPTLVGYFICSCLLVHQFHFDSSFLMDTTSKLWSYCVFVVWWAYLLLLISSILSRESPNVLVYWFLGAAALGLYVSIHDTQRHKAFQMHIDQIPDAKGLVLHLQELLGLTVSTAPGAQENLNGYTQYHKKFCSDPTCPLRSDNMLKRDKQAFSSYEQFINLKYGMVSNYISHQFKLGLTTHQDSLDLRILYCFYLAEISKNTQQALDQLALCLHSPQIPLDKMFVVERLKKMVIKEAVNSQDRASRDIVLSNNNDLNKRVKKLLEEISLKMLDFWGIFLKESPDMRRLMQLCKRIRNLDYELEDIMEQERQKGSLDLDVLRQFASFQEIVMMDENRAENVYQQIKTAKNAKAALGEYDLILKKSDELSKQSSAIIIISGMRVDYF